VAAESQRVNPPVQEDESERHQILEQPGAAQEQPERQLRPGGLPPRAPRRARANSLGGGSQGSGHLSFGSNNQAPIQFQQFNQQNQKSNVTMQLSGGRGNIVDRDALDEALQNRINEEENEDESQNINEFYAEKSPELPFHLQDPNMRRPPRDQQDDDEG